MNTSYSPNEERFGFHASGVFRCSYHSEKVVSIILTIAAILIFLILFGIYIGEIRTNPTGATFYLIRLIGIFYIPIGFAYFMVINLLFRGQEYRYTADEIRFTIFCPDSSVGRKTIYITYSDVVAVTYQKNTLFGIERGYKVTIITNKQTYYFDYCIERYRKLNSTDTTPFHIIEERSSGAKPEFYV